MNRKTTDEIIASGTREELVERLREYVSISLRLENAVHEAIKELEKVSSRGL